ncbi:MAG TPA: hypothetical protein VGO52_17005 [Hyphomonadaceae bacterium]|jgi:hypothetical protein|nr:hypothetical protein [Hyphomonadaceae bacterium]
MRASALAIGLLMLGAPAASGQQPYSPPRATDGHPDLQGIWTMRWTTPLERPADATSLAASGAEAAAMHKAARERMLNNNAGGYANQDLASLALVRGEARAWLVVDPADGKVPYTRDGRALSDGFAINKGADGPEQRWYNERCVGTGLGIGAAPLLILPVGNIRQIVQTPDSVVIYTEAFNQLRIIPMDGRPAIRLPRGPSSVGHWEGETLVVETSGFHADDQFRRSALATFPLSPASRITERFVRVGEEEIDYRFTIEDPVLYSRAWTAETSLKKSTEYMYEFACHEGNYSMAGILGGARADERRAAKVKPRRN